MNYKDFDNSYQFLNTHEDLFSQFLNDYNIPKSFNEYDLELNCVNVDKKIEEIAKPKPKNLTKEVLEKESKGIIDDNNDLLKRKSRRSKDSTELLTNEINKLRAMLNSKSNTNNLAEKCESTCKSHDLSSLKVNQKEEVISDLNTEKEIEEYHFKDEDYLRREIRKIKNRLSARKSRENKKTKMMDIEKDNKNLKIENNQLLELKNKFEIFEKLKNVINI